MKQLLLSILVFGIISFIIHKMIETKQCNSPVMRTPRFDK